MNLKHGKQFQNLFAQIVLEMSLFPLSVKLVLLMRIGWGPLYTMILLSFYFPKMDGETLCHFLDFQTMMR